jgi:hypothetical protein
VNGIKPVLLQDWETREIVSQRHVEIAVEIMIAQCRVDWNSTFTPDGSLLIVLLPVVYVVAIKSDIATKGDEVRMSCGNARTNC